MVKVSKVSFLKSASKISNSPPPDRVEIAILGRSNVGKSSTINSLVERKNLAKSSNTPGKTKLINFFDVVFKLDEVEKHFRLVDLPGIGYAKVSKEQKREWDKNLNRFILERETISLFIYLIDARHRDLEIDTQVFEYLQSLNRNILKVYTKIDKLKKNDLNNLRRGEKEALFISNTKKKGILELREKIWEIV